MAVPAEVETFAALLATVTDEAERERLIAAAKMKAVKGAPDEAFELPGLTLDLDAPADAPRWIVHGVIERGTVAILAGDTGAAKSIVSQWLTVQALKGNDWFNRTTHIDRVIYVDEENPDRLVKARLRAMGLRNDELNRLRYVSRHGVTLGKDADDAKLRATIASAQPDLVVIDTLMSASAVDVNDNVAAVEMMKKMRGLAREFDCAVLILHHERKQQKDGPASGSSQQTLGARQWVGQTDALLTIATEGEMSRTDLDDGGFKLRRTFKLKLAEKDRDGRLNGTRRIAVESEKDDAERLMWMTVTDEGALSQATAKDDDAVAILTALRNAEGDGFMGRKDIAGATGEKDPSSPSGTWKTALKDAVDSEHAEHVGQRYRITESGRDHLAALRSTAIAGAI
ncbi:MAG: ATPase [Conexibacter sp.]|nr:ATPase [Conexibacter sp.]